MTNCRFGLMLVGLACAFSLAQDVTPPDIDQRLQLRPSQDGAVQSAMAADPPERHAVMPYSNWRIVSSTRRAPVSVASISIGALPSKRRLGFRNHRHAFPASRNARSAIVAIRATRTALSESPLESGWRLAMRCARVLRGTTN